MITMLKKYTSFAIMLIIALTIAGNIKSKPVSAVDVTADFTDANFLTCVSTALGTPGSVDDGDAAALTGALNCNIQSISNIEGVRYLTGITALSLSTNNISDLSPLSGMTNFTSLNLNSNNFNDSELSNLNSLTNLSSLSLNGNSISDISGVTWGGLTGLTLLNLSSNNLDSVDLTAISGLTNLNTLVLSYNNITTLNDLSGLINLTALYLQVNSISDTSPLSGLVNLTALILIDNNISDLAPIGSGNLTLVGFADGPNNINISNNTGLNGLNAVAALAEVATLQSNGATVTHDITSNIHDEFTDVNFQQCVDIAVSGDDDTIDATLAAALSGTLSCNGLSISNISGAQYLTGITGLNLTSNNLDSEDLTNISGLTTLNTLLLGYNNITTLNDLSGLINLTALYLQVNSISDTSPLSGLVNLTALILIDNNISDLAPIGSGNLTLVGFADGPNNINISNNTGLNGLNAVAALAEVATLQSNGATVTHDITSNIHDEFTDVNFQQCVDIAVSGDDDTIDATLAAALTTLDCNTQSISSIAGAQHLTGLTSLDLNTNSISDVSFLSALTNLTTLNLFSNIISVLSPIGSSNATLTGFRDNNVINLSYNNFTGVEEAALTEIHDYLEATPNPAVVTHNIDWENCTDSIDNDDDGDIDSADIYCYVPTSYYVDYDTGSGTDCTEASPCANINNVFVLNPDFETLVTTAPVEDVNIYVQGTYNSPDYTSVLSYAITSNITIQPWGSTPIIDGGRISITSQSTTLEGFEIKNATSYGVSVTGDGSTIRNNHIHDNGIGIYMGSSKGLGGNNISVYNNVLTDNENIAANMCGGILTGGTTDNIIINNTLYNNCSTFSFNGTTIFMAGDIVLAAVPGMGLSAPVNTLVKQNLVYNDLVGTGNTYYYNVSGELINGVVAAGVITNQTAADFGTGNNFSERVTIPFFYDYSYSADLKIDCPLLPFNSVSSMFAKLFIPEAHAIGATICVEIKRAFALSDIYIADYQVSSLDINTPNTDFAGNTRPSGISEAGAIENQSSGGGGEDEPTTDDGTPIVCTPLPTQLNISDTIVMQKDGQSTVTLKWGQAGLIDINPNQKVEIFFDYLNQSPPAKIGLNNIRLQNVFAYHIYDEVTGSLKETFDAELGSINSDVCDDSTAGDILEIIKSIKDDAEMNLLIVDFINDLLSLENTIIESSSTAKMDFTDYYYNLFSNGSSAGTVKVVRKVNKGGIYIPDGITEINSDVQSWTDTNIPSTDVSKMYKYQIITENCGETKSGNEVEVVIDPVIPAGTDVDVILDLKISIKDAYNNLLMERFRKLFIEETYEFDYERTCDEIKDKLFNTANSEYGLEYLITCYGEEDVKLMNEIASREMYIVPPLVRLLNIGLDEGEINTRIGQIIEEIKIKISLDEDVRIYAQDEQLPVGDFVNELDVNNLSTSEMGIIKLLGKEYFEGVSHSANIEIEKYNKDNVLLETFNTNTDIFGNVVVRIGEFVSGDDYTLKIKLGDERFVLPKMVTMQINNAVKELRPFGTVYTANIGLEFDRSFRYGDFNEDGEINLSDIGGWGKLLKGEVAGDYDLWELWKFANLDGLGGIDLLDIVTLQENWGGEKDFRVEDSEVTLREILELFGISITSDPTLDAMVKVAGWLDLVGVEC